MSAARRVLAVVATHPIQYQVPWFQALAAEPSLDLTVYFACLPDAQAQGAGFGIPFAWDIPLLDGYRWECLPNRRARPRLDRFFGSSTPGVGRVLAARKPDAVLVTGWNAWPLLQAILACRRLHLPVLLRGDSNALRDRPAPARFLHRRLFGQVAAFLSVGRSNRDFYAANGVPAARIFDVPHFVDNARFAASAAEARAQRAVLREQWRIPPGALCVLFVGKVEPKKRLADLVHAAAAAAAQGVRLHLLVVGEGPLRLQAEAQAGGLGVPATFAGFLNQSELGRAYACADVLVLPSDAGETWGLVVNEAMACGLPAVVSHLVGCGPDLVAEGVTGHTYPCGDVATLGTVLVRLARDPAACAAMGERARERVQAYSVARAVEGTRRAVDAVAA